MYFYIIYVFTDFFLGRQFSGVKNEKNVLLYVLYRKKKQAELFQNLALSGFVSVGGSRLVADVLRCAKSDKVCRL